MCHWKAFFRVTLQNKIQQSGLMNNNHLQAERWASFLKLMSFINQKKKNQKTSTSHLHPFIISLCTAFAIIIFPPTNNDWVQIPEHSWKESLIWAHQGHYGKSGPQSLAAHPAFWFVFFCIYEKKINRGWGGGGKAMDSWECFKIKRWSK